MNVLRGNGLIETESVAKLGDVLGASAFAEHLLDRIAGNDVGEKENHGDDEPEGGKREQNALEEAAKHFSMRGVGSWRYARAQVYALVIFAQWTKSEAAKVRKCAMGRD